MHYHEIYRYLFINSEIRQRTPTNTLLTCTEILLNLAFLTKFPSKTRDFLYIVEISKSIKIPIKIFSKCFRNPKKKFPCSLHFE